MRIDPSWQTLSQHAARHYDISLRDLIAGDPQRPNDFSLRVGPLYANFARQRYDRDARVALLELGQAVNISAAIRAQFEGASVNVSENRPALHTALRSRLTDSVIARAACDEAAEARKRMAGLIAELTASGITDIVNVGIGGSDLGPRLAVDALRDFSNGRFRIHFLNNADGHPVQRLLPALDRSRTAVVLVSKSFSTQETLLNGRILKDWLGRDEALYAVSANVDKARAFGVDAARILPMWDWVGGRYSLWSAVGFVVALAIGMDNFEAMLAGAAEMDAHVLNTSPEGNLVFWHALSAIWNRNGLGFDTHAVVPYDERLGLLPAYLQQLVMESLGKSARSDGNAAEQATVPVLWGGTGTSSQHSFFQALHQGTDTVPADFIGVVNPAHSFLESHHVLLAHLLAQTQALANGEDNADAQKRYAGNRPSTLFLLDRLDPNSFGALIAMYEHSVYAQSVLWGINAFDQWGVELGKRVADDLLPAVAGNADGDVSDPVTRALLAEIRAHTL
jgi:glucose-6-phosphate isomerase